MKRLNILRRLLRSRSGVAMTEFALGAPFLMLAGIYGVEEANFVLVNMKINQIAAHIADNASRVGDTSQLQYRKVYESDINDVLVGAQVQAGQSINLFKYGRVIISSLEAVNQPGISNQLIHWQRCRGAETVSSSYGNEGTLVSGMGPAGKEVTAEPNDGVIFVEVRYTYQPLITGVLISNRQIRSIAAFNVRDSRDLSGGLYQRDTAKPDPVQSCNVYTGEIVIGTDGTMA
ncbi:MAG: pilus assembly protein [Proteobacteria bacterium]|nr:pilus assembly protein [Pseudomonadota bacterium]